MSKCVGLSGCPYSDSCRERLGGERHRLCLAFDEDINRIKCEDRIAIITAKIGPAGVDEQIDIFEVDTINPAESFDSYLKCTFLKGPGSWHLKQGIPKNMIYRVCTTAHIFSMLEKKPFGYETVVLEEEIELGRKMIKDQFLRDKEHCRKVLSEIAQHLGLSIKNVYPEL